MFSGDELESFTHFTLLVCEDAVGELKQGNEYSDYFWEDKPDFTDPRMLPNMKSLVAKYEAGEPFFLEETLQI
ncbi:MAG: hypothetical protein WBC13_00170, partial [Dokdonella sp.]